MFIKRGIQKNIEKSLFKGKIIVLYGPRRVGKTTLVKQLQKGYPSSKYLNCDEPDIRALLTNKTSTEIKAFLGSSNFVIIDEAQRIENIGITLKLIVDTYPDIQVIATGSSSFDLSNSIKEPLTGRTYEFKLFPLSITELLGIYSDLEIDRLKERFLRFGTYPDIILDPSEAESLITSISYDYLYKDALRFQDLRNTEIIDNLLQALALQVGNEVSYTELSSLLGIDKKTVEKYINILEKAFVLYKVTPFSRNLRKELTKKRKIYFWDNGIRNALIRNFNELNLRQDTGSLWEQFVISQRIVSNHNKQKSFNKYFWRTWDGSEVDYIEEMSGRILGYEIKWGDKKMSAPKAWVDSYPKATFSIVNQSNWKDFVIAAI